MDLNKENQIKIAKLFLNRFDDIAIEILKIKDLDDNIINSIINEVSHRDIDFLDKLGFDKKLLFKWKSSIPN